MFPEWYLQALLQVGRDRSAVDPDGARARRCNFELSCPVLVVEWTICSCPGRLAQRYTMHLVCVMKPLTLTETSIQRLSMLESVAIR